MIDSAGRPPLDWRAIERATAGQTIGRSVRYLPSTASTNDLAREDAQAGAPEGTVVLADEQTAGRGRIGKSRWLTPARTSIALSVVLRPGSGPATLPLLSMAMAVAGAEGIERACRVGVRVKWPNDLVVRDLKVGGVLVESVIVGESVAFAVAGIGVNGNMPATVLGDLPDAAVTPTTLLDETGGPVSREAIVIAVLETLDDLYRQLAVGELSAVQARYRRLLTTLGRSVRVADGRGTVDGYAESLAADGGLVVRLASGERRHFGYGEVSLRPREGYEPRRAP